MNIALVLLVAYLAKSANAYVDLFLNSNDTSNLLGNQLIEFLLEVFCVCPRDLCVQVFQALCFTCIMVSSDRIRYRIDWTCRGIKIESSSAGERMGPKRFVYLLIRFIRLRMQSLQLEFMLGVVEQFFICLLLIKKTGLVFGVEQIQFLRRFILYNTVNSR